MKTVLIISTLSIISFPQQSLIEFCNDNFHTQKNKREKKKRSRRRKVFLSQSLQLIVVVDVVSIYEIRI